MTSSLKHRVFDGLVYVALAGLLTAILLPILRSAPGSQDDETCLSHLRQLGTACSAYTEDYDGYLVPYALSSGLGAKRWAELIAPYVENDPVLFRCPLDLLQDTLPGIPFPTTYGVNWYLSGYAGTGQPGRHSQEILDAAGTIQAADTAVIVLSSANLPPDQWREDVRKAPTADIYYFYLPQHPVTGVTQPQWSSPDFLGSIVRPFPRHAGFVNAMFYDGHAAAVPASQFDPAVTKWGDASCLWDNVSGAPIGMPDVRMALQVMAGLYKPTMADLTRLNVNKSGASAKRVDLGDAASLARKVSGLDP